MERLGIEESDLHEYFTLGSGSGGQKINKTSSCVHLKHLPTGIEVKSQQDRSQAANRFRARIELCNRIEEMRREEQARRRHEREKKRRRNRRRSRAAKERMLEAKHRQSSRKQHRRPVGEAE
jgi:protein subunit release factor B